MKNSLLFLLLLAKSSTRFQAKFELFKQAKDRDVSLETLSSTIFYGMKYGTIKPCKNIAQAYPPHSLENLQSRAFISHSPSPTDTVPSPTFQPSNSKPAGTWLAELQHNSGQQENDEDRQAILNLIDKRFSAVRCLSKLKLLSDFAVDMPIWIQTLKNKFP